MTSPKTSKPKGIMAWAVIDASDTAHKGEIGADLNGMSFIFQDEFKAECYSKRYISQDIIQVEIRPISKKRKVKP